MSNSSTRWKYVAFSQLALGGYWLTLLVATHVPTTTPLLPGQGVDTIYHFFAYAVLAGLLATAWQLAAGYLTTRHLLWAWLAIVLYGVVDELTQIPVGRTCSFWDWLADALGAAAALLIFHWWNRRYRQSPP